MDWDKELNDVKKDFLDAADDLLEVAKKANKKLHEWTNKKDDEPETPATQKDDT